MQVIPAVDLFSGRVVRLIKGDRCNQKEYGEPLEIVNRWEEMGAEMIHVIDLDAAFGIGSNGSLIEKILSESQSSFQVGGGIRSREAAIRLLQKGAARIILGSLAFREPEAVARLIEEYGPERVIVSLDYSAERVKISGWAKEVGINVDKALENFKKNGVKLFLITSIDRDGTLTSPDTNTIRRLSVRARVIAAGGVSTLSDLASLSRAGVEATVVGRALYESRFTLSEAKEAAR